MFERARVQIGRPPCNVMLDGGVVSVYNVQEEKLGKSITLGTLWKEVSCRNVRQGDFPNFPRNVQVINAALPCFKSVLSRGMLQNLF